MKKIIILCTLLVLIPLEVMGLGNTEIKIVSKYDGKGVALKWLVDPSKDEYTYELYRQDTAHPTPVLIKKLKKISYIEAQKNSDVKKYIQLLYPYKSAKNQKEKFKIASQESNRDAFKTILVISDNKAAAAFGLYFKDTTIQPDTHYKYIVKVIEKSQTIATKSLEITTNKKSLAPLKIKTLKTISYTWGIGLIWGKEHKDEVFSYNVYRSATKNGHYKKVNEGLVFAQERREDGSLSPYYFSDNSLKKGVKYYYRIKANDLFGEEGAYSNTIMGELKVDKRPPTTKRPTIKVSDKKIVLSWERVRLKKVVGYNVYRSFMYDDGFVKINKHLLHKATYTDTDYILGRNYFYYITTVDNNKRESIPSLKVMATPNDVTPPPAPRKVTSSRKGAVINLKWEPVKDKTLLGYKVYSMLDPKVKEWALVNKEILKEPHFTHTLDKSQSRYAFYYKVVALDKNYNQSKPSKIISVKLPDVTPPYAPVVTNYKMGKTSITFTWNKVEEYDLSYYNVYKYKNNRRVKLNKRPIKKTTFRDTHPDVNATIYAITAVDKSKNESIVDHNLTLSFVDKVAPKIQRFRVSRKGKEVHLSVKCKAKDYKGFDILRGESTKQMFKLASVKGKKSYIDTHAYAGYKLYYQIRVYDKSGNFSDSKIKTIFIKKAKK